MRINSINFNNNNMSKNQSFGSGAVKVYKPGAAEKVLGYTREKVFNTLAESKNIDVWVFDKMLGSKGNMVDGCQIIVKDDFHIIKELAGAPDKKGEILDKLTEVLLWFKPELNEQIASAVKKTDTLNKNRIEQINATYINAKAKQVELDKEIKQSLDGQRFVNDFYNRLLGTMESSKTTSWEDKIRDIDITA